MARRGDSSSSGSDDEFEKFLSRMRIPRSASCCTPRTRNSSSKNLFSSPEDKYGFAAKDSRPLRAAKASDVAGRAAACSAGSIFSPLSCSDPDSEDDPVFVGGPPGNPSHPLPPASPWRGSAASWGRPGSSLLQSQRQSSRESESSDEEVESLVVRMKRRFFFPEARRAGSQQGPREEGGLGSSLESPATAAKSKGSLPSAARIPAPGTPPSPGTSKSKALLDITQSATRMQMGGPCRVQGCFLQELSDPESQLAKHFQSQKEGLAQRLYSFYNHSIFEEKLPERMEMIWNKKMQKTAGCCVTGQLKNPEMQRYAKIILSEKVCDSADRLRDTLIHELCHAATWLIHGVRDGHGRFWNLYAKKSATIHPELPVVSRCHNYEIKYKFTYECLQCKNTIGRHSKSLDTQRFVCALCKGQLELRQPKLKDGTPAKAPLAPFAKYVKENYSSVKHSQQGLSHGAIMRKLSVDFASHS
ncbi:acidic repeat-containing protein [Pseudonaja textilis]|uniref:acidic repeat-containing protein n=1 Tax=Pseudonaja textilis TaxID=8673 RepID=UPI000EA924F9|nr:acidic repeat-containing protein [Pseudonaja textilis]